MRETMDALKALLSPDATAEVLGSGFGTEVGVLLRSRRRWLLFLYGKLLEILRDQKEKYAATRNVAWLEFSTPAPSAPKA